LIKSKTFLFIWAWPTSPFSPGPAHAPRTSPLPPTASLGPHVRGWHAPVQTAPPVGRGQAPRPPSATWCPRRPDHPPSAVSSSRPLKRVLPPSPPTFPAPLLLFRSNHAIDNPLSLPFLAAGPPPPSRLPEIARAAPPPKHHRPKSTPPPHRHATALVHPRRSRLARHLPLFLRELSPPVSLRLIAQLDAAGRASPPPRVWPPHAGRAEWMLGHAIGRCATARGPALAVCHRSWADLRPSPVRAFLNLFELLK
jgi:hypothetical protein